MNQIICQATIEDLSSIREIYAYYVENTNISFDYDTPSIQEMQLEMQTIQLRNLPYLVAKDSQTNQVIGFAYALPFSKRKAYDCTCTLSIYVDHKLQARGIGQQLYHTLEQQLTELGMVQLLSLVASDNKSSLEFHYRNGFVQIGEFPNAGYKFNKWHSIYWLLKTINAYKITSKKTRSK
ncbi:GNAT family N-acetyltransferase [Aerococcaceae bacterium NML190938]|nr:GNAT family N-acetyltransferase [Aerococcaceae bacterium NML190938]